MRTAARKSVSAGRLAFQYVRPISAWSGALTDDTSKVSTSAARVRFSAHACAEPLIEYHCAPLTTPLWKKPLVWIIELALANFCPMYVYSLSSGPRAGTPPAVVRALVVVRRRDHQRPRRA
jgi:hypothetical protein